jgi:hypothetical protein
MPNLKVFFTKNPNFHNKNANFCKIADFLKNADFLKKRQCKNTDFCKKSSFLAKIRRRRKFCKNWEKKFFRGNRFSQKVRGILQKSDRIFAKIMFFYPKTNFGNRHIILMG